MRPKRIRATARVVSAWVKPVRMIRRRRRTLFYYIQIAIGNERFALHISRKAYHALIPRDPR